MSTSNANKRSHPSQRRYPPEIRERTTRMDRALYPGWAGRADHARLARIGRDQTAGPEVARAVAALEAVNSAVIAGVAVSAGASGGHAH